MTIAGAAAKAQKELQTIADIMDDVFMRTTISECRMDEEIHEIECRRIKRAAKRGLRALLQV